MPFVIINLGGEMIYILEQRLRAQNIPPEKSVKVLHDVVRTMFSSKFIAEVFKPAQVYSTASTRQIFERLAHSSIMRLSESSMDKLYDLMTMGLKYQLLASRSANEIFQVTINHIETIRSCINDPGVLDLVSCCEDALRINYQNFTNGDWSQLRQSLIGFFHHKKIKVSLFLQEGLQLSDGRIALPPAIPLPDYISSLGPLGQVKMFSPTGDTVDSYTLLLAQSAASAPHPVPLGGNLYGKDRPAAPKRASPSASSSSSKSHSNSQEPYKHPLLNSPASSRPSLSGGGVKSNTANTSISNFPTKSHSLVDRSVNADDLWRGPGAGVEAKKELNLLASLIGPAPKPTENFKINLFPETHETTPTGKSVSHQAHVDNTIIIDTSIGDRSGVSGLADIMKSFDLDTAENKPLPPVDDGSDLLDLMDGL